MKVSVTNGSKTYIDQPDWVCDSFYEAQGNGANPHLEAMTFKEYTRPVCFNAKEIDQFNQPGGYHFIFGWWECFCQSDDVPGWMHEADSLTIEVSE